MLRRLMFQFSTQTPKIFKKFHLVLAALDIKRCAIYSEFLASLAMPSIRLGCAK